MEDLKNYFITGGAGFIGGHLANYLFDNTKSRITIYDNFENGRFTHLEKELRIVVYK